MEERGTSRKDRKTAERNRRNQMKDLYSKLNSLLPHGSSSKESAASIPDQLAEATSYIKRLQTNLERMKEKKDNLMEVYMDSNNVTAMGPTLTKTQMDTAFDSLTDWVYDPSTSKKPRVVWSVELHQQFVSAVNQLGIDKAVPKRILELMNVPGLTRENVARHLQKFRLYLERLSGVARQSGMPNTFCGPLDSGVKLNPLGRFDIQALAASGQIPPETLAALQSLKCISVEQGIGYGQPLVKCQPNLSKSFSRNAVSMEEIAAGFGAWPCATVGGIGPSSNIINDCGIRIPTGADEDFVNCRRLATFHSNTADLLLLLIPSRSIALNLRAECLVKVYLPGSKDALVQDLVNLKQLDLSCSSFSRIPDLSRACKLQSLDLHSCNNLVDVAFIQYLTKLEYINLKGCTSLARLPSLMALKLLLSLDLSDCINLRGLPPSLGCLSSLAALDLSNCKRIQNLPKGILRLKSVQTLSISGCSMLMEQACLDGMLIENQVNPIAHSSSHASDEQTLSISGCSMLMERASGPEGMIIEHQVNPIAHSSSHASNEEVSMSYLPVDKYVPTIPLQQPEEERIIRKYNSVASKDAAEPSSTTEDLELHKEVLKAYMNMPVEAINQANAFYCVQRTVDSLIRRNPNSHENASLHDLTYCLEELQESVPETMSRMHDARVSKASIQVKWVHLHSSFVQSEGHYNGLAARFSVISDEEEDLDAEIDRLLAKRRELLD